MLLINNISCVKQTDLKHILFNKEQICSLYF